jgi:hypothetical protein
MIELLEHGGAVILHLHHSASTALPAELDMAVLGDTDVALLIDA